MKWSKTSEVSVIEATDEAVMEYGLRFGTSKIVLTKEDLQALLDGKMLAWNDEEYSTFVVYEGEEEQDGTETAEATPEGTG